MVDIFKMIVYKFQYDKDVIKIARQNSKHLQKIAQANLTDDQYEVIFPDTEYSSCSWWDRLKCVGELTGRQKYTKF